MKSIVPVVTALVFATLPAIAAMHLAVFNLPDLQAQLPAEKALDAEFW